ncbi:MAG: hypothetical protein HRT89_02500 [Lentisphaeria bacterium]|nr:hypothetical protein [Lentisphaeria bacterium]NQZ66919.1 hypothetical protein [Lentisphaeria bacterium]
MDNIDINPGGLIGALVIGGIGFAILFANVDVDSGRAPYRLAIFILIGGAIAGNYIWASIFKKPKE